MPTYWQRYPETPGNLVTNGNFDTVSGLGGAGASRALVHDPTLFGPRTLAVGPVAAAGSYAALNFNVPASTPIKVSYYVYIPSGTPVTGLNPNYPIMQTSATGMPIVSMGTYSQVPQRDQWVRVVAPTVNSTVAGGVAQIRMYSFNQDTQTYYDGLRIETGTVANPFSPVEPGAPVRLTTVDADPLPADDLNIVLDRSFPYTTTNPNEMGVLRETFAPYAEERSGILRATNKVTNPSFETTTSTWTTLTSTGITATITREAANAVVGAFAGRLQASFPAANETQFAAAVAATNGTVVPGRTYFASATTNAVTLPTQDPAYVFVIRWLNSSAGIISDSYIGSTQFGLGQTTFSGSAVAPAGASTAQVYINVVRNPSAANALSNVDLYFDAVMLADPGTTSPYFPGQTMPYFDGSQPGGQTAWSGGQHASTSLLYI